MNNIIKRKWNQNSMVIIEDLQGMAFQAESGGHTFQISGIDGEGNAVALSGTPAGVMLRADGQDVALTCSVSGGVVSATLPANAYSVPGRFGLTIFLTSDGQKTAIYAAVGTVGKTSSGTVAPPAGSDVVDLVNAIAAAVATIPASYTDLMAAMAPTYSSSGLYAVGSYAWYNGKLYRCTTAITSGETWTSGHWTLANLGSDLVDLKSALSEDTYNLFPAYNFTSKTVGAMGLAVDYPEIILNGSTTEAIAPEITENAVLPAGSYYIGNYLGNQGFQIQVRNASDDTIIAQTATKTDFTLVSETTIYCRVSISANKTLSNAKLKPMLAKDSWPSFFIPNLTAVDSVARKSIDTIVSELLASYKYRFSSSTDANDYTDNGWYYLIYGGSYTHIPDIKGNPAYLINYSVSSVNNVQIILCPAFGVIYQRRSGGSPMVWEEWVKVGENEINELYAVLGEKTLNLIPGYIIDDKTVVNVRLQRHGYVIHISGTANANGSPAITDKFTLSAGTYYFGNANPGNYQLQLRKVDGSTETIIIQTASHDSVTLESDTVVYVRIALTNTYQYNSDVMPMLFKGAWYDYFIPPITAIDYIARHSFDALDRVSLYKRTQSESFTPVSVATQGDNIGVPLRVMSYNICQYNNDTEVFISNESLFNLKKCIRIANADYIMLQEDRENIDSGNTKNSFDYVFRPVFSRKYGYNGTTVISKKACIADGIAYYSVGGRTLRYDTFSIDETKTLLVVSTHPSPSSATESERAQQYDELFKWLKGEIDLYEYAAQEPTIHCPAWTHCIIGMDANSATDTDKENLVNYATAKNFVCGNGGALGWFYTLHRNGNKAIDNIIVSNNIIINNIEAYSDWYDRLYSDHVPVVADLTLLNS